MQFDTEIAVVVRSDIEVCQKLAVSRPHHADVRWYFIFVLDND